MLKVGLSRRRSAGCEEVRNTGTTSLLSSGHRMLRRIVRHKVLSIATQSPQHRLQLTSNTASFALMAVRWCHISTSQKPALQPTSSSIYQIVNTSTEEKKIWQFSTLDSFACFVLIQAVWAQALLLVKVSSVTWRVFVFSSTRGREELFLDGVKT